MSYFNQKAPRPEKTIIRKKGNIEYVYRYTSIFYDKDKKRGDNRQELIGKMIPESNMMVVNENYLSFYGNSLVEDIEENLLYRGEVSVGLSIVIDHISESLHLDSLLKKVFKNNYPMFMAITKYVLSTSSFVMQHLPGWALKNHSNLNKTTSGSSLSRFLSTPEFSSLFEEFLYEWAVNIAHTNQQILLSVDSTNMNTSSTNLTYADYGHAKKDKSMKQINVAYAINQVNGLPLFYDVYPGSINDTTHLKIMVDKANDFKYENLCFILDRGYFSEENIEYMQKNGYDFLMMAKSNLSFYRQIISKFEDKLKHDLTNYLTDSEIHGMAIKTKISPKNTEEYYVYVYYDEKVSSQITTQWKNDSIKALKSLKEEFSKKPIIVTDEMKEKYDGLIIFTTDKNGYATEIKPDDEFYQKLRLYSGTFMIVSSLKYSTEQALALYRKRDISEKGFRSIKTEFDNETYAVASDNSMRTKAFISFLCSIIRSHLASKAKLYTSKNSSETINTIIQQLRSISIIKRSKSYQLSTALSKKQKDILLELNIPLSVFDQKLAKIVNEI